MSCAFRRRRAPLVALLLGALLAVACTTDDPFQPGVSISLTATPPRTGVGMDVVFEFRATGASLTRVVLDYGDGAVDSVEAFGASEASGSPTHAYAAPGTYRASASAVDAQRGTTMTAVTVTIVP